MYEPPSYPTLTFNIGFRLPPAKRRVVGVLNQTIHPNTDIVVNWLPEQGIKTAASQHSESLPQGSFDHVIQALALKDQLQSRNVTYTSEVREALSAAIAARKERLEIYRIMY